MKLRKMWWLCALLAVTGVMAQVTTAQQAKDSAGTAATSTVAETVSGGCTGAPMMFGLAPDTETSKLLANMDSSANPCQDFYEYADGGWIKNNPIPAAYPRWGTFNLLQDHNQEVLRGILEAAAKADAAKGSNAAKNRRPLRGVHEHRRDRQAGRRAAERRVRAHRRHQEPEGPATRNGVAAERGTSVLFRFESDQDFKDSTQMIGDLTQGGLGLPDRDYYTKTDDKSKTIRDQYVAHVTKMFTLLGDAPDKAASEAQTVLAVETKMAEASMSRVDRRDPDKTYHPMDRGQLDGLMRNFAWNSYLDEVGVPKVQKVNVGQPDFFKALDGQLAATPIDDWKIYMRWHLIHATAPLLSQAVRG